MCAEDKRIKRAAYIKNCIRSHGRVNAAPPNRLMEVLDLQRTIMDKRK